MSSPGEALVEWVTHDMGETEATQEALARFLFRLEARDHKCLRDVLEEWSKVVRAWEGEDP